MAEVKLITGGTYNVEPQGPGSQVALPDCIPPDDPEIPLERFGTFFAPFKESSGPRCRSSPTSQEPSTSSRSPPVRSPSGESASMSSPRSTASS